MKLYNRELEEIQNSERQTRIENITKKQIEFLIQTYGINEEMLKDRLEGLAVIERHPTDKTYFAEYNGEKKELRNSSTIAAFVTMKNQEYDGTKWSFENGVYISDKNSDHKITHELFHFLSKKQQMTFNENDIGYSKTGTSILSYDRQDNLIDSSLNAKGLNEGITEFLAAKMDGVRPDSYEFQAYLTDILVSSQHPSLLKAYFSDDEKDFKEFLEEFNSRQACIPSEKLVSLSGYGWLVDTQLLKGCLEYSLSFCNNVEELGAEQKRLLPIIESIANNKQLDFDIEDFNVKQFFDDILMQKRQSIEATSDKGDRKNILDSAIEATEETTRTDTINTQAGTIKELAQGKDERIEGTEIK